MDSKITSLDFAAIGHQDNWQNIVSFINGLRTLELEQLPLEKIKDIYSYIPSRYVFKMKVKSKIGIEINGIYIDTFIDPDNLDVKHLRTNIKKVYKAINVAQKHNTKIVTLGGFTSIVLEGNVSEIDTSNTKLTTGNTLTSAFILKGVEKAAYELKMNFKESSTLIIGATGDIGMACANYLKGKVKNLLLCARNKKRLENFSHQIRDDVQAVKYSTDLNDLINEADIIICVASSKEIKIVKHKNPVIICDAGYPKNIEQKIETNHGVSLFHGGMGQIKFGYKFIPDYSKYFYRYPAPNIGHGCVLEAIVLAFEKKFNNYSTGKGNITNEQIDEIYRLSVKHGIEIAPFYNAKGLWKN